MSEPEAQELSVSDTFTNENKNAININVATANDTFTFTFPLQLGGFFRFMFPPRNTIVSINDKCLCVEGYNECQPIKCIEKTVTYLNIRYTFYCDFYYNTDVIVSNRYNYLEIDIRDRGQPCLYPLTDDRKQKCIATLDTIFDKFNTRKNEMEN